MSIPDTVKSFMQMFLRVLFSTVFMVINYAAILSSFDTLIATRIALAFFGDEGLTGNKSVQTLPTAVPSISSL